MGPGWLVHNALRGLVAMSPTPHHTLFRERQSAHCPPPVLELGLWGETVHLHGIVSDTPGSMALWLVWVLW